jgi:hypothetical protein
MGTDFRRIIWLALAGLGLPLLCYPAGPAAAGDIIFFKDGMRTRCSGAAWEENNEVRCEYEGGILVYSKQDVLSIQRSPSPPPTSAPAESPAAAKSEQPAQGTPSALPAAVSPPSPSASGFSGILFYDPRRPKRYWSSENRHHDTYRDAIGALAEEFGQPEQWIESHMGDSNDVGVIRESLAARQQKGDTGPAGGDAPAEAGGVEFYNPRRPQPYWTGPNTRHRGFHEAVETLSQEFGMPTAWVEAHMGDSNDTAQIRKALEDAKQAAFDRTNVSNSALKR